MQAEHPSNAAPDHPGPGDAGALLTIDLKALADNWRLLADMASGAECAGVIKADGYGIGLEHAARMLFAAGCRTFFVALPEEGRRARVAVPGATIYVLDGLMPGHAADYARDHLRPVLGSGDEIAEWSAFCRLAGDHPAAVHVDTAMNRLGLRIDEAAMLAADGESFAAFTPALVMSHLASGDDPDDPLNARQLDRFGTVRALFPGVPAALANSAGILLGPAYHFDLVRPGIALYGGSPRIAGFDNPMQTVVTLEARVLLVREARADETVGYGAAETLVRDSRLAVVAVGYADGFHRAASSSDAHAGGRGVIAGRSVPIVGRISMDLIALDITDLPEDAVRRGDLVELIGPNVSVDEVAANAGTISYEILTSLGRRYRRHHIGLGA